MMEIITIDHHQRWSDSEMVRSICDAILRNKPELLTEIALADVAGQKRYDQLSKKLKAEKVTSDALITKLEDHYAEIEHRYFLEMERVQKLKAEADQQVRKVDKLDRKIEQKDAKIIELGKLIDSLGKSPMNRRKY